MQENNDVLQVQSINSKGYGIIPKLVMQDKRLTIEAKAIYAYFCSFAGSGQTAFPGRDRIVADLGIGTKRYYKHFNLLKKYRYIEVKQTKSGTGGFQRNVYTLIDTVACSQDDHAPCSQDDTTACSQNAPANINSSKINIYNSRKRTHPRNKNKTQNYKGRIWDYAKLQQLERRYIDRKVATQECQTNQQHPSKTQYPPQSSATTAPTPSSSTSSEWIRRLQGLCPPSLHQSDLPALC